MNSEKKQRTTGWILSGLLGAFFLFSASGKILQPPEMAEILSKLGYTAEVMFPIGVLEIMCVVLFLIPRTAFLGIILLTAYLGGATSTHVRIGDPFFFPPLFGALAWVAYGLRNPDVIRAGFKMKQRNGK